MQAPLLSVISQQFSKINRLKQTQEKTIFCLKNNFLHSLFFKNRLVNADFIDLLYKLGLNLRTDKRRGKL